MTKSRNINKNWDWLTQDALQDLVNQHGTLTAVAEFLQVSRFDLQGVISRRNISISYDLSRRRKKPSLLDQYREQIVYLIQIGWNCGRIQHALQIQVDAEQIRRKIHQWGYSEFLPPAGAQTGERNLQWRGGVGQRVYHFVKAPDGHPFARPDGYIREHRLVMEKKLGRYLDPQEVVHHIDGNAQNNHPDNLMVLSAAEHGKIETEISAQDNSERQFDLLLEDRLFVETHL